MANETVSRRGVLPAVVAGAAVLALSESAVADDRRSRRFSAIVGPAGVVAGQTLISAFHLPAVQRGADGRSKFRLSLYTVDGKPIASDEYAVAPGGGAASTLQVLGDGSVRFNGRLLDFRVPPGEQAHIIAILIGLLLPAVQSNPSATLQCSNNLRTENGESLGPVSYILPYVEQSN